MIAIAVKSILQAIPTLFVVSVIMFLLLFVGPNPLEMLKQNPSFRDEDVKRITKLYGWDKSLTEQYTRWAGNFMQGDFGMSVVTQRPAKEMISERVPLTLMLTGLSLLVSLLIAIPVGAYVAVRKYSRADYAVTFATFGMMATPAFFLALLMQLGALKLQDLTGGTLVFYTGGAPACADSFISCLGTPIEVLRRLTLPVLALSMLNIAGWSRYQRSELLSVLDADYVKSARAKGLPWRDVFIKHAMRNTMLPIVTIIALDIAMLFGGAVITETVFGLPGMGSLLLESLRNRDVVVVLAIVMISTFLVLVASTVLDIVYGMLDPRVRVA